MEQHTTKTAKILHWDEKPCADAYIFKMLIKTNVMQNAQANVHSSERNVICCKAHENQFNMRVKHALKGQLTGQNMLVSNRQKTFQLMNHNPVFLNQEDFEIWISPSCSHTCTHSLPMLPKNTRLGVTKIQLIAYSSALLFSALKLFLVLALTCFCPPIYCDHFCSIKTQFRYLSYSGHASGETLLGTIR